MDNLEDLLAEQENEYTTLMAEKYEEEERIFNEMAWQFLLNRSARRIQRYWRAYRERKLARKKGRRAPPKEKVTVQRQGDANAALASDRKIKGHVFEELQNPGATFEKNVTVDLTA
nr:unnamed protein product [Callosobruchus analis]